MLFLALCLAGLAPGAATAWLLHKRHGWLTAALAGLGVTASLPCLLVVVMMVFPPLGLVVGVGSILAALRAYDAGRVWVATIWVVTALAALTCAGVAL
ncbi:hypothetical protein ACF1GW_35575 [Streptomyces achromogenes]|uniref:hypothetical protein n=1 Tax=Streptomyces achromogenes TaxID=67255 RepID=UPI00370242E1